MLYVFAGRMFRSMLMIAALAFFAGGSAGQSTTTLYLVQSRPLELLSQAEVAPGVPNPDNKLWIGHRLSCIAYDRGRLLVAGEATSGPLPRDGDDADGDGNRTELSPFNIAIVKIDSFLTNPTFHRVTGSRRGVGVYEGYTGLDAAANQGANVRGLIAAYDPIGGGPNLLTRYNVEPLGDGTLIAPIPTLLTGFRLGSSGPAWDFGPAGIGVDYAPNGAPDGIADGPVVAALVFDEAGPFGTNPATLNAGLGATLYEVGVNNGPRLSPDGEGDRAWRDLSIDRRNGDLAARASNTVVFCTRNTNGTATRVDLAPADPMTERVVPGIVTATSYQRISILGGFDDGGIGDLLVWNDRGSTAAGQSFAGVVKFNKTDRANPADSGSSVTATLLNADNSPAILPTGNAAYDFSWDAGTRLLLIADVANQSVHLLSTERPRACCLPTGECFLLNSSACVSPEVGGAAGSVGSVCAPGTCPQPTIACCFPGGDCQLTTPVPCVDAGGTARPLGVTCTPNPCTTVSGACCEATACTVVAFPACAGSFKGAGSVCEFVGNPVTCCPANINRVAGVTVQDVFDFLADYFVGDPAADFNGVDGISVQDIFDFLAAYFRGCVA